MKKGIKCIEVIVQIFTAIMGLFAICQLIISWAYKRKMARKALDYLEDEFVAEAHLGNTINVYSPTITENRNKLTALLAVTGVGCIILLILKALRISRS